MKGSGLLQELLQKLRSPTAVNVVQMIAFSSLRRVPLQKMLVPESSAIVAVSVPK